MQNIHDCVSPLDFRYYGADPEVFERVKPYLSEAAFIKYQARAERALVLTFFDMGWCPSPLSNEILEACDAVTADEVYEEEKKTGHIVRALVNCITKKVSAEAGRFVHLFATSADITDTASALRFQEFVRDILLPDLLDLQATLIKLAREHARTPQIGRTHGQHAEPITFGFSIALYVDRLGGRIQLLEETRQNLPGQLSGAVGAYNALSLQLPRGAVMFEKLFLSHLGLQPAPGSISSQVVQPEYITDLGYAAHSCFSVLANLADDIRHLHRSEIGEVQEQYSAETVGSSTMPHKINPKNFENIKGMWKAFAPRITTLLMDQISEHQRDLTNSASQRFLPELFVALDYCTVRLNRAMSALRINKEAMRNNLEVSKEHIVAEPLYILLALQGYGEAYERVRAIARKAREEGKRLIDLAREDADIGPRLKGLRPEHLEILEDPSKYTGQAYERAIDVCDQRESEICQLREYLKDEKEVLSTTKAEHFGSIYEQVRAREAGEPAPKGFCPAENRKKFLKAWIEDVKLNKQRTNNIVEMKKGVNS
ncbi:MAG: lyase family protein [Gammaproteobacteria bacterium]